MFSAQRSLTIETPRLRLRPFVAGDLEELVRVNADPQVARFLNYGKPMTRAESWRQIALFIGHRELRGYTVLAIEDRATGALLGRSGPWYPEGWPMLEVGWVVDSSRRGEGIAGEAGRASIDWCYANLRVDRVCSIIRPDNLASARVAEKLGARIERQLEDFFGGVANLWVHERK
ncbi:MAG: GNAT family N-acetyltransferase [Pirellulales bacterium]